MDGSLNRLHELLFAKGIAFARYSLPGNEKTLTLISFHPLAFQEINSLAKQEQEGFVFAPFVVSKEHPIWFLSTDKIIDESTDIQAVEEYLNTFPDVKHKITIPETTSSKNEYSRAFNLYMNKLKSGTLDKAILSKIKTKPRTEESLFSLFTRLTKTYSKAFAYLIHLPTGELWMGATPELLLLKDDKGLKTMALAGTQLLQERSLKEVVWQKKEIDEQAYVRKYVEKILSTVSDSVKVSETYTSQAGNLVHLRSDFSIEENFERYKIIELVKNLHPTPAVCGIPLEKSKELILNTEQFNRAYYTGFLGPIKANEINLFVNLRCMKVMPEKFALYVGGGITRDSELEREWEETEAKAQTLLSVIHP